MLWLSTLISLKTLGLLDKALNAFHIRGQNWREILHYESYKTDIAALPFIVDVRKDRVVSGRADGTV